MRKFNNPAFPKDAVCYIKYQSIWNASSWEDDLLKVTTFLSLFAPYWDPKVPVPPFFCKSEFQMWLKLALFG